NHFRNTDAVLKHNMFLTTNVVNEARASLQRNVADVKTRQQFTDNQVGIRPVTPEINFLAPITVLGLFDSGGLTDPNFNLSNHFQLGDQISWTRRRHFIRTVLDYGLITSHWQ